MPQVLALAKSVAATVLGQFHFTLWPIDADPAYISSTKNKVPSHLQLRSWKVLVIQTYYWEKPIRKNIISFILDLFTHDRRRLKLSNTFNYRCQVGQAPMGRPSRPRMKPYSDWAKVMAY